MRSSVKDLCISLNLSDCLPVGWFGYQTLLKESWSYMYIHLFTCKPSIYLALDTFYTRVSTTGQPPVTPLTTPERYQCKAVYLHVLTSNTAAMQFYKSRCFQQFEFLPLYYAINGVQRDGFSFVLYINGGEPPWTLAYPLMYLHFSLCNIADVWKVIKLISPFCPQGNRVWLGVSREKCVIEVCTSAWRVWGLAVGTSFWSWPVFSDLSRIFINSVVLSSFLFMNGYWSTIFGDLREY